MQQLLGRYGPEDNVTFGESGHFENIIFDGCNFTNKPLRATFINCKFFGRAAEQALEWVKRDGCLEFDMRTGIVTDYNFNTNK